MMNFDLQYILQFLPLIKIFMVIAAVLTIAAISTYLERKILSLMQMRKGPNVVGPFGWFQPIADGLKAFSKEILVPKHAYKFLFILAPIVTFTVYLTLWAFIPFATDFILSNIDLSVLLVLALLSFSVYGILIAGFASRSRYAIIGAVRIGAQMISFDIVFGLIVLIIVLTAGSLNLNQIVIAQKHFYYIIPHFPLFVAFIICMLAESNRTPFDLPEAETETVSGHLVEYSGLPFAYFFLGEYLSMLFMSTLGAILFLGGYNPVFGITAIHPAIWLGIKAAILWFIYIWVRATLPRFRTDQLMKLCWKYLLPLCLFWLLLTLGGIYEF